MRDICVLKGFLCDKCSVTTGWKEKENFIVFLCGFVAKPPVWMFARETVSLSTGLGSASSVGWRAPGWRGGGLEQAVLAQSHSAVRSDQLPGRGCCWSWSWHGADWPYSCLPGPLSPLSAHPANSPGRWGQTDKTKLTQNSGATRQFGESFITKFFISHPSMKSLSMFFLLNLLNCVEICLISSQLGLQPRPQSHHTFLTAVWVLIRAPLASLLALRSWYLNCVPGGLVSQLKCYSNIAGQSVTTIISLFPREPPDLASLGRYGDEAVWGGEWLHFLLH